MRKKLSFLIFILLASCVDAFEEDLTEKTLILLSPPDSYSTKINSHQLFWEEMDGATDYQVRVDQNGYLQTDTLVQATRLEANFKNGESRWCVRALNTTSQTIFFCRTITVSP